MRRLLLGLAGTVMTGALSLFPSAAHAETTLCVGKSFDETMACDPGWAVNMMFMHWRMYRGHNCTNYVAWRLSKDGVQEPPYLLGNAISWAKNASKHGVPVDSTPEAGSAGVWSGRNHVVYIEQVGPGWLEITEDSYSLKRYRRYIAYKGERNYPSKFIHFRGRNAINGGTPTVSGTPLVGSLLTANPGTWSPSGVRLAYQWLRDGVVISGATSRSYRLVRADAGHKMSVSITGTYSGKLPRTASSLQTDPVSAGTITPGVPTISGLPIVGTTVSAAPGTWRPADIKLTYQWFADGKPISGETKPTYTIKKKKAGKALTVRVTGSGPGYQAVPAMSAPTAKVVKQGEAVGPVTPGVPTITGPSSMMVGDRLQATGGTWAPLPVNLHPQWLRDGRVIEGATAWAYTLAPGDVGKHVSVQVTGTKKLFTTAKTTSVATSVVYERKLRPLVEPTVTGSSDVGGTLTATVGQWMPAGSRTTVAWTRDGKTIVGATGLTYVVKPDDFRHVLTALFTTTYPKFPADVRRIHLPAARAVPTLGLRAAAPVKKHSKRLMVTVNSIRGQLAGLVRVTEAGQRINTFKLSRTAPVPYDFVSSPGTHTLTFTYVGPDWLVPTTRVVPIEIK